MRKPFGAGGADPACGCGGVARRESSQSSQPLRPAGIGHDRAGAGELPGAVLVVVEVPAVVEALVDAAPQPPLEVGERDADADPGDHVPGRGAVELLDAG